MPKQQAVDDYGQHHPCRSISLIRSLRLIPYCQAIVIKVNSLLHSLK